MHWNDQFLLLFDRSCSLYRSGNHEVESYYTPADLEFLVSIGCQPREFFDFVEDYCEEQTPTPSTALLIAAARREGVAVSG
jgi:hypothetical protein